MILVLTILLVGFSIAHSESNNYRDNSVLPIIPVDSYTRSEFLVRIPSVVDQSLHVNPDDQRIYLNAENTAVQDHSSGKTFSILAPQYRKSNPSELEDVQDTPGPSAETKLILSGGMSLVKESNSYPTEVTFNFTEVMLDTYQPVNQLENNSSERASSTFAMPKLALTNVESTGSEMSGFLRSSENSQNTSGMEELQWFGKSYSTVSINNVSLEILNCSGFIQESGEMFPSSLTWSRDVEKLGCPYGFKICLPLCCSPGEAMFGNSCVKENDDFYNMTQIQISICMIDSQDLVNTFMNDDYNYDWMVSGEIQNFLVLEYGLLSSPDFDDGLLLDPEDYCLFREPRSFLYSAKIWSPEARKTWWDIFCIVCIILIMMAIFICCSMIPQLKSLHGVIFRSYVITFIGIYVFELGTDLAIGFKTRITWFTFLKNSAYYSECACALWLNVMSISIWRTFRGRGFIDYNSQKYQKRNFMWYAIHAWGSPAVLVVTCATLIHYQPHLNDVLGRTLTWWCNLSLSIVAFICNIFFYISTAFAIRRTKKEIANLTVGVNKHHEVAKQWLNMYVKLFIIMTGPMGGGMVPLILWLVWPTDLMTGVLHAVELVQSILTLYVFIWKDEIKRQIRDKFRTKTSGLHELFSRNDLTSTAESGTISTTV